MNHVDEQINSLIMEYVSEAEKGNFSRDMQEQARRIQKLIDSHTKCDVLASGYWGSLHDQARLSIVRDAVLELVEAVAKASAKPKPAPVQSSPVESSAVEQAEAPAPKKRGRKPKVAA